MQGKADARQSSPHIVVGYLPLIVVGALIVALVWFVPSEVPDGDSVAAGNARAGPVGDVGVAASGWDELVTSCDDRERQDDVLDYSPPCFEFSGDNGGATAPGVTEDTIRVSYRHLGESGHFIQTLAMLAGQSLGETPDDLWRTTEVLVEYINENFELYGRAIELVRYDGRGDLMQELLGAGQENASIDARQAAQEDVFADVTSFSQPYAEQLVHQGVLSMGVPYMSQSWFDERAPLAWSPFPDCSYVAEITADVLIERLADERVAFGPGAGAERRVGAVYPSNEQYSICGEAFQEQLEASDVDLAPPQTYPLDFGAAAENASAILDGLQREGITTVGYAGDPVMLDRLVALAEQQGYEPEWLVTGVGFVDMDLVGQMVAADAGEQWSRAFGVSATGSPVPFDDTGAYDAYRSIRPDDEGPTMALEFIHSNVIRLAIGFQMAGPELTPETFAEGMYNYPETSGWMGTLNFGPENQSGRIDARIMAWSPEEVSPFNGEPGSWVDGGNRFRDVADAPTQEELVAVMDDEDDDEGEGEGDEGGSDEDDGEVG